MKTQNTYLALSLLIFNATIHPIQSSLPKAARTIYALQKRTILDFTRVNFDVVTDEINKNKKQSTSETTNNSNLNSSRCFYQTATEYGEYIYGKKVKLGNVHQNIIGLSTFIPVSKITLQNNDKTSSWFQEMTLSEINFELLSSYLHLKKLDNDPVDLCDDHNRDKFHEIFKKNNTSRSLVNDFFTTKQNALMRENEQINSTDRIDKLIAQRFGVQHKISEDASAIKINNDMKLQILTQQQNHMHKLLQRQHELEKIEDEKELLIELEYNKEIARKKAIHEAKYSTQIKRFIEQTDLYKSMTSKIHADMQSKLSNDYKDQTPLDFFENSLKRNRK